MLLRSEGGRASRLLLDEIARRVGRTVDTAAIARLLLTQETKNELRRSGRLEPLRCERSTRTAGSERARSASDLLKAQLLIFSRQANDGRAKSRAHVGPLLSQLLRFGSRDC